MELLNSCDSVLLIATKYDEEEDNAKTADNIITNVKDKIIKTVVGYLYGKQLLQIFPGKFDCFFLTKGNEISVLDRSDCFVKDKNLIDIVNSGMTVNNNSDQECLKCIEYISENKLNYNLNLLENCQSFIVIAQRKKFFKRVNRFYDIEFNIFINY
ncbi:hypothetical protein ABK040_007297 [Willaertia magna]